MDSLVGRYYSSEGSSDEGPLFQSPHSRRKRGTNVLDSDSEGDEPHAQPPKSPVRKKKKGVSAIRDKFRESMKAIEKEKQSGSRSSDPEGSGTSGGTSGLEVENADGAGQQDGGEIENLDHNGNPMSLLMKEVKAGNKMLMELTNRVKKNEKRLKVVENEPRKSSESCSSSGSTPKQSRKRDVPDEVRVCVLRLGGTILLLDMAAS